MKELLGGGCGLMGEGNEDDKGEEIKWGEDREGKVDLLVSVDLRMSGRGLY